jgi:hypothetical protein
MQYDVKKIRRRIEDWLRKKATEAQLVALAKAIGIKLG